MAHGVMTGALAVGCVRMRNDDVIDPLQLGPPVPGLDGVGHAAVVGQRAAEDDEAVIHEPVHEGSVLRPLRLLLQRARAVELGTGLAQHDEEHRHAGNLAWSGPASGCF
jgi:hypothetical protein